MERIVKILSSVKHCYFPITLLSLKKGQMMKTLFSLCFHVKKCPHIVLTGRFTQRDCHSRTLSLCYSVFCRNPPTSLLQFGRLQTEITNHKLELCLIVRMIMLTEQRIYTLHYFECILPKSFQNHI